MNCATTITTTRPSLPLSMLASKLLISNRGFEDDGYAHSYGLSGLIAASAARYHHKVQREVLNEVEAMGYSGEEYNAAVAARLGAWKGCSWVLLDQELLDLVAEERRRERLAIEVLAWEAVCDRRIRQYRTGIYFVSPSGTSYLYRGNGSWVREELERYDPDDAGEWVRTPVRRMDLPLGLRLVGAWEPRISTAYTRPWRVCPDAPRHHVLVGDGETPDWERRSSR